MCHKSLPRSSTTIEKRQPISIPRSGLSIVETENKIVSIPRRGLTFSTILCILQAKISPWFSVSSPWFSVKGISVTQSTQSFTEFHRVLWRLGDHHIVKHGQESKLCEEKGKIEI